MMNENDEKQKESFVRELGVFELRGVARQLGVPSPTTKKRDELISLILEATRNGKTTEENMQKRGRPFKKLNILDTITNKISPDKIERLDFESVVRFNQDEVVDFGIINDKTFFFEGIVRKIKDTTRMFDFKSYETIFIPSDVDYYGELSSGDRVTVEAKKLSGQNGYVVLNIIEINSLPAQDYKNNSRAYGEEIIDDRALPFDEGEVKLGRRNVYLLKEDLYENNILDKFYNKCNENKLHFIALGVNTSFENQIKLKNIGVQDNFTTVYGSDNLESFNKIIDAIVYSNNLLEKGKDVVIFIPDIIDVLRCLDEYFAEEQVNGQHTTKSIIIAQKLLSFAKSFKDGPSGTIVMCYNESDLDDKFITNDILKISKKI